MAMPRFESAPSVTHVPRALAHAGELAQWSVTLLAWLWLGEQGMRWGWGWASGVLAVALWWSARLWVRGSTWALQSHPLRMATLGFLTALGVGLPEVLTQSEGAHLGLLLLAGVWGVWSGCLETRNRVSTFQLGKLAWHPLVAGALVALIAQASKGSWLSHGAVMLVLAFSAAVFSARDRWGAAPSLTCAGPRSGASELLAPSAMGLMMGSLWLGNVWCAGLGWRTETMLGVHLALMAGAPPLVAGLMRWQGTWAANRLAHRNVTFLSLALLVVGALMLLGQSPVHGLLAMLLPSLAWALHCVAPREGRDLLHRMPPWLARATALLLGPGLLLWVGTLSPVVGPAAVQWAMALLGTLAALQLVVQWTSPARQARWSAL